VRKSNPDYLLTQFQNELTGLIDYFDRVSESIAGTQHEMADLSRLAENTFVSAYVGFEGFISNLFVAYLNRDPTVFQQFNDNSMRQRVQAKFGQWNANRIAFATIPHLNVDQLRDILDPNQRNITFSSVAAMKQRAQEILAPEYANRIGNLTAHDDRVIDTSRAIRNYISHRSDNAYQQMNAALSTVDQGPPNTALGRGVNLIQAVGAFLKSETANERRVIVYVRRLHDISGTMSH
jgi:hypothetical protein